MDKAAIFTVTNHHHASCSMPPHVDDRDPRQYRGYFENAHGEQSIFVYDRETREATLYIGDCGWEEAIPIRDGMIEGIILAEDERRWLQACWSAVTFYGQQS